MKPAYWVLNPLHMEVIMILPSPKKTPEKDQHLQIMHKKKTTLANYAPKKTKHPKRPAICILTI